MHFRGASGSNSEGLQRLSQFPKHRPILALSHGLSYGHSGCVLAGGGRGGGNLETAAQGTGTSLGFYLSYKLAYLEIHT